MTVDFQNIMTKLKQRPNDLSFIRRRYASTSGCRPWSRYHISRLVYAAGLQMVLRHFPVGNSPDSDRPARQVDEPRI